MLAQLLPTNLFALMLVFARVGSALMLLPGIGELYVPQRFRLLLALFFAAIVATLVAPALPELPASPARLATLVGGEVGIGLFLGTLTRMLLTALETAGMIISFQLGLSSAQAFNPTLQQQSAVFSAFMTVLGVLVLFLTDTHHLMLRAVVGSYGIFPPGEFPPIGDLADTIGRVAGKSFEIAAELSAPFIVIGTMFYVALGLLSRLMPQLQIFFVALPLQIAGGLIAFAVTLYAVMHWFVDAYIAALGAILSF